MTLTSMPRCALKRTKFTESSSWCQTWTLLGTPLASLILPTRFVNQFKIIQGKTSFVKRANIITLNHYLRASLKHEVKFSPIEFLELFGTKEIDGRKSYNDEDSSEERVCRRIPKIIYPKMAKNQANQWIYVVNGKLTFN